MTLVAQLKYRILLQAVDMFILSAGLYIWRQIPIVGRLAAPVVNSHLATPVVS